MTARGGGVLGFAFAFAVAAPSPASAQQAAESAPTRSVPCLWTSLTIPEQLRLELAAKTKQAFSVQDLNWIGDRRLADVLLGCGFDPLTESVEIMARYWAARAAIAGKRNDMRRAGVAPTIADAAIAATAPQAARGRFAVEIAENADGDAAAAIRAAVDQVASAIGGLNDRATLATAEYFVAVVLADGIAAGDATQ